MIKSEAALCKEARFVLHLAEIQQVMNNYAFEQGSRLNRKVSWHSACFPGNAG